MDNSRISWRNGFKSENWKHRQRKKTTNTKKKIINESFCNPNLIRKFVFASAKVTQHECCTTQEVSESKKNQFNGATGLRYGALGHISKMRRHSFCLSRVVIANNLNLSCFAFTALRLLPFSFSFTFLYTLATFCYCYFFLFFIPLRLALSTAYILFDAQTCSLTDFFSSYFAKTLQAFANDLLLPLFGMPGLKPALYLLFLRHFIFLVFCFLLFFQLCIVVRICGCWPLMAIVV